MFAPALLTWAVFRAAWASLRLLRRWCVVGPLRFVGRAWRAVLAAVGAVGLLQWTAQAQQRTATWYADNPGELVRMRRWCLDNPGPAFRSDDCAAAQRGGLLVAEREAEAWLRAQPMPVWPPAHLVAPPPEPEVAPVPPPLPADRPRRGPPRRT
jgi:hypothetical protein